MASLRFMTRIPRFLQVLWTSSDATSASVDGHARDEEALHTSTASVRSTRRSLHYRAMVFILILVPTAAVVAPAFCVYGVLFGMAVATLRFGMILPILIPVAFTSGTVLSPSHDYPDKIYVFQFLLQFLQASIVAMCALFAVAMFAGGVMQAWKVVQWTPEQSRTTPVLQADRATGVEGKDWKSTFQELYTAVIESSRWFLAPFAYAGAHMLRYLCGGGWELLLPDRGGSWPVWLVMIGEGLVRLVVLCRTYERNYRIVRERLELERANDSNTLESIKLDGAEVDASKV